MKKVLAVVWIAICISFNLQAADQPVILQWRIPSDTLLIGEALPATIEVTLQDATPPDWAVLLSGISPWEVLSIDTFPIQQNTDQLYQHAVLASITTFDAGEYRLGPLQLAREKDTFFSNILNVLVLEVQVDTTKDILPIIPPMKAPLSWQEWTVRIVAGILLLVALLLIWKAWKMWRRKNKNKSLPVLDKPVKDWAMEELRQLEEKLPALSAKEIKDFYDHLSYIMRVFMHYQYGIPALELTSGEIERRVKDITGYERWSPEIMPVMKVADLAKFAKATPAGDHQKDALQKAINWVQGSTKKTVEQP